MSNLIQTIALKSLCCLVEYLANKHEYTSLENKISDFFSAACTWLESQRGIRDHFSHLIHEIGHGITARVLFQGVPKIVLDPLLEKKTIYNTQYLTCIGRALGKNNAKMWVLLGGPAFSMIFWVFCLCIEHIYPKKPENTLAGQLKEAISSVKLSCFFSEFWSAFSSWSSFSCCKKSAIMHVSDYVKLWKNYGIHPIYLMSAMVLVQIVAKNTCVNILTQITQSDEPN